MCETTSVTWHFLQPLLQPFLEVSICGVNFFKFTFSTSLKHHSEVIYMLEYSTVDQVSAHLSKY